jgi:metal-responsive CopG/Arc/MetJ family transcriptional regulator
MSKKSKTQMTKAELITLSSNLEKTVKEQQTEIENLQNDRIALDSTIVDQDTSIIISGMNARIKALETKIIDLDSRKDYE